MGFQIGRHFAALVRRIALAGVGAPIAGAIAIAASLAASAPGQAATDPPDVALTDSESAQPPTSAGSAAAAGSSSASPNYHASLGIGNYLYPRYPGAQGSHDLWFPFLDADYADRIYTSVADLLGLYACKTETTQAGVALEYDPTRRRSADDPRLADFPSVRQTTRFKIFGVHTVSFVTADANVARDVMGHHQGTVAQANLWLTAPFTSTFSVSAGPGLNWSDSRYMQTFYQVTTVESVLSPLPAYQAHAGVSEVHWNALAEWQLRSRYRIGASATTAGLRNDAAASPVTVHRQQTTFTGWLAYKFN